MKSDMRRSVERAVNVSHAPCWRHRDMYSVGGRRRATHIAMTWRGRRCVRSVFVCEDCASRFAMKYGLHLAV
jgi:hypothetical protein